MKTKASSKPSGASSVRVPSLSMITGSAAAHREQTFIVNRSRGGGEQYRHHVSRVMLIE